MSHCLKRIHWGIVVACFFLPVVRGCRDEIIYPYRELADGVNWVSLFVFLYPLVLALVAWLVFRVIASRFRAKVLWWLGYALGLGLIYILLKLVEENVDWYTAPLVFLWGILFLGLARGREVRALADLLGFVLTGVALWFFRIAYLFSEEILIGGWIYIYASAFILAAYMVEFLKGKKAAAV